MANVNEDVIRHEDTTTNLPSSSRNGQVTFETDGNRRMRHATLDGTANFFTPDDKLTAEIPTYTNGGYPAVATVKDALDVALATVPVGAQTVLTGSLNSSGAAGIFFPSGYTQDNCVIASCLIIPATDPYVRLPAPIFVPGGTGTYWILIGFASESGPVATIEISMGADAQAVYGSGAYVVILQRIS